MKTAKILQRSKVGNALHVTEEQPVKGVKFLRSLEVCVFVTATVRFSFCRSPVYGVPLNHESKTEEFLVLVFHCNRKISTNIKNNKI